MAKFHLVVAALAVSALGPARASAPAAVGQPVLSAMEFHEAFKGFDTLPSPPPNAQTKLIPPPPRPSVDRNESARESDLGHGIASYYGRELDGRRTASGERFSMNAMTAAHLTLPFGSRVRVTNAENGRSVIVRINDRGPFTRNRIMDMSEAAARQLGLVARGSGRVRLALLGR